MVVDKGSVSVVVLGRDANTNVQPSLKRFGTYSTFPIATVTQMRFADGTERAVTVDSI